MIGKDEIEHRFGTHKATIEGEEATLPKHQTLRLEFKSFAGALDHELPDSREKSLALTALEEASMWSHKALAKTAPLVDDEPVFRASEPVFRDARTGSFVTEAFAHQNPDITVREQ